MTEYSQAFALNASWEIDRAQMRALAEAAPIMVWMTDTHGLCVYLNPEWYKITGQELGKAEGFGWADHLHADDRSKTLESLIRAHRTREDYSGRFRLKRSNGAYLCVSSWAQPTFQVDGTFNGFLGAAAPIADLPGNSDSSAQVLTSREREVMSLVAAGKTSEEIALVLNIAARTVDAHIKAAAERLGATNRTHAAVLAVLRREVTTATSIGASVDGFSS